MAMYMAGLDTVYNPIQVTNYVRGLSNYLNSHELNTGIDNNNILGLLRNQFSGHLRVQYDLLNTIRFINLDLRRVQHDLLNTIRFVNLDLRRVQHDLLNITRLVYFDLRRTHHDTGDR